MAAAHEHHVVIRVDSLAKEYTLGSGSNGSAGIRHALHDAALLPVRWLRTRTAHPSASDSPSNRPARSDGDRFWALQDVSFDVRRGEVLGIIGRNGAGKSTLLKLLSRITEPTRGRIGITGRVASLLEVGTGFHPELTGRENIFLNGAILGMSRAEIKQTFDEIVAFAGVERFLDTPVKRYSSGMYVRLAFSVAAHLRPEILIVDEVLAVGDAEFQAKCIGRMQDVGRSGRTVLFVSHNLPLVERLCSRAIRLKDGRMVQDGLPTDVCSAYLNESAPNGIEWIYRGPSLDGPYFRRAYLCGPDGEPAGEIWSNEQAAVGLELDIPKETPGLVVAVAVKSAAGQWLFSTTPTDRGVTIPKNPGMYRLKVVLPQAILMPKTFSITLAAYTPYQNFHKVEDALTFTVAERVSLANAIPGGRVGELQVLCDWDVTAAEAAAI